MKVRHVGIGVSVTIQAVVCLYCCLVAYLLADLPLDDAVAVGMDSAAWNWMAATRFGLGAAVGAGVAGLALAWNGYVLRLALRVRRWIAVAIFSLITGSTLAGVAEFLWTRPIV